MWWLWLFFLVGCLWRFGMLRTWFVCFLWTCCVCPPRNSRNDATVVRWNSCVYHNSAQNHIYIIRSLIFIYTSHMLMQKIELKRTNRASCLLWTAELEAHVISLQLISSWKQQLLIISKSFCYKKKTCWCDKAMYVYVHAFHVLLVEKKHHQYVHEKLDESKIIWIIHICICMNYIIEHSIWINHSWKEKLVHASCLGVHLSHQEWKVKMNRGGSFGKWTDYYLTISGAGLHNILFAYFT